MHQAQQDDTNCIELRHSHIKTSTTFCQVSLLPIVNRLSMHHLAITFNSWFKLVNTTNLHVNFKLNPKCSAHGENFTLCPSHEIPTSFEMIKVNVTSLLGFVNTEG